MAQTRGAAKRGTGGSKRKQPASPRNRGLSARERLWASGYQRGMSEQLEQLLGKKWNAGRNVTVSNPYCEIPAVYRAANVIKGAFNDGIQQLMLETKAGDADRLVETNEGGKIGDAFELFRTPLKIVPKPGEPGRDRVVLSQRKFKSIVAIQAMVWKAAYVLILRGSFMGRPVRLVPTIPGSICPKVLESDPFELVCWEFNYRGFRAELRPEDVLCIPFAPDPFNPFGGVAPTEPAADDIDTAKGQTVYRKSALANSGMSGILNFKSNDPIDEKEAAEIKRRLYEGNAGPNNAEKVAVITGEAAFIPLGPSTARNMQLSDGERKTLESIVIVSGVSPVLMGIMDSASLSKATVEVQRALVYHNSVFDFAGSYDEEMTKVAQEFDERLYIKTNFQHLSALKEDASARWERAKLARDLGYPINMVNKTFELDMPEIEEEWASRPLILGQLYPAEMVAEGMALPGAYLPGPQGALPAPEDEDDQGDDDAPRPVVPIEHAKAVGEVVKQVATGEIPRDAGLGQLVALYGLTQSQAEQVMGSAGIEKEKKPEQLPPPPPQIPPPPPQLEGQGTEAERTQRAAPTPVSREEIRTARWRAFAKKLDPFRDKIESRLRKELNRQKSRILASVTESDPANPPSPDAESEDTEARAQIVAKARLLEQRYGFEPELCFRFASPESVARSLPAHFSRGAALTMKVLDPKALAESVRVTIEQAFSAGGLGASKELIDIGVADDSVIEAEKKRLSKVAGQYWDKRLELLVDVGDSIRLELRDSLVEGYTQGESLNKLKDRVRDVMGVSLKRARTIARTESASAVNGGRFESTKEVAAGETKEWMSARDGNERPTHGLPPAGIDSERQRMDEPFSNGLMFPGDESDDAGEVVNCRCTFTPVSEEFEAFEAETQIAASVDVESDYVMVRVSAENLARRALHLGLAPPTDRIARAVLFLLGEQARSESGNRPLLEAEQAEILRTQCQEDRGAIAGAALRLGDRVFADEWRRGFGQEARAA